MHFSVHRLEQCFCIMILTSEFHVIYANPIIMIIIKAKINIFGEDMHCRWNVLSVKWLSVKCTVGEMTVGKTYCRQNELSAKRTVGKMNCRRKDCRLNVLSMKWISVKWTGPLIYTPLRISIPLSVIRMVGKSLRKGYFSTNYVLRIY